MPPACLHALRRQAAVILPLRPSQEPTNNQPLQAHASIGPPPFKGMSTLSSILLGVWRPARSGVRLPNALVPVAVVRWLACCSALPRRRPPTPSKPSPSRLVALVGVHARDALNMPLLDATFLPLHRVLHASLLTAVCLKPHLSPCCSRATDAGHRRRLQARHVVSRLVHLFAHDFSVHEHTLPWVNGPWFDRHPNLLFAASSATHAHALALALARCICASSLTSPST